jgi:hypothetical protein
MAKSGLTLADVITAQQKNHLEMSSFVQQQLQTQINSETILKDIKQIQSKTLDALQGTSNDSKSKKDAEEVKKSLTSKTGDGLNSNILKLGRTMKELNGKIIKAPAKMSKEQTEGITNLATGIKTFSGIKERVSDFKKGVTDKFGSKNIGTTLLKSVNVGGIFDKQIAQNEFIKQQRNLGSRKAEKTLRSDFDKRNEVAKEIKKNEDKLEKLKKETKLNESQLGKTKIGSSLLETRENLASKFGKFDKRSQLLASDEDEDNTESGGSSTSRAKNKSGKSSSDKAKVLSPAEEEFQLDQTALQTEQLDLLKKIEENTRTGSVADTPNTQSEDKKGGLFSGLGDKMKGVGDSLSGAAKGLLALAGSVWIISKAFQNFAKVKIGDFMMGIGAIAALTIASKNLKDSDASKTLLGLGAALWMTSKAFQNFADVSFGDFLLGIGAIAALTFAASKLKDSDASKTLLGLGAALWITSKAFQNFAKVEIGDFMMGIGAIAALTVAVKSMSGSSGGVVALLALGAAVFVVSKAFQNFSELSWSDVFKGITAIGLLGVGVALLAPLAVPIAIISGAFLVLGSALWVVSKAFENISESFPAFTDGLERLANIGGMKLISVAAGIVAIGSAMAVFGAAQMVAALENLVTKFLSFGDDTPVEQLIKIGEAGPGIEKAATGLERLAAAMKSFGEVDEDALDAAVDAAEDIADAFEDTPVTINLGSGSGAGAAGGASGSGALTDAPIATSPYGTRESSAVTPSILQSQPSNVVPITKAPMTNASNTLKGVTGDEIKNHPNFKKYYEEALQINPNDKISAYEDAAMSVKDDMIREKQLNPNQIKPTQPEAANTIYGKSSQVAEGDKKSNANKPNTIVSAPTSISNQTKNVMVKQPIRNPEGSVNNYLKSRYV